MGDIFLKIEPLKSQNGRIEMVKIAEKYVTSRALTFSGSNKTVCAVTIQ